MGKKRIKLNLLLSLTMVLFSACKGAKFGEPGTEEESLEKIGIESCVITPNDEDEGILASISCPDGSTMDIPQVLDGKDGDNGIDGLNGSSCSVSAVVGGAMIICSDSTQAFIRDGEDGHSCGVSQVNDYASLIECTDGSQSLIDINSMVQYSVTQTIDPCGDHPGHFDEVILQFNNGDLLAYFQSGSKRFLTLLTPGNYQTTDAQKCLFQVTAAGDVIDSNP